MSQAIDIRLIAQEYIDQGWSVVPVSPGEKKTTQKWQKKTYGPNDFGPDDNIAGKVPEPIFHEPTSNAQSFDFWPPPTHRRNRIGF